MRLSVTGVTSGVGLRLADAAIAAGHTLTALVRSPDRKDARELEARGVRLVAGDLDSSSALNELCRDAEVVVHLAAHVGDAGTPQQFYRVNVIGTRNILDAAAAQGAKRFIHLSSTAVYGRPDHGRVTEEWPTRKIGLPYEDTKTEAERLAFERGAAHGLAVVAVRPPIIYGPHDRNFMPRALKMLRARRFLLIGGGNAPLNVVWVDHVVDVVLRAAEHTGLAGEAFNVMDEVDRRPPTVREVAETIAREAKLPPPRLSLPYPAAMGLSYLAEKAYSVFKPGETPPLTPFVVKIMTRHVIYDASKAARVLGWKPQTTALEGLARAAREAVAAGQ